MAQVLVQNRVSLALPVIPRLVQNEGINVKKMSPNTLMIVNLISPGQKLRRHFPEQLRHDLRQGRTGPPSRRRRHHLPRPARLQPARLARSRQIGRAQPERQRTSSPPSAQQNIQVAAGQIGQQPAPAGQQFQLTINTLGRLTDPEQFADIIIKAANAGGPMATSSASSTGQTGAGGVSGSTVAANAGGSSSAASPSTGIVRLRDVVTRTPEQTCPTEPKSQANRVSSWARSSTTNPARSTASPRSRCRSINCPAPTRWKPRQVSTPKCAS